MIVLPIYHHMINSHAYTEGGMIAFKFKQQYSQVGQINPSISLQTVRLIVPTAWIIFYNAAAQQTHVLCVIVSQVK